MEEVILVDEQDREVGVLEKLEAHRQGVLHRAFSIFLFNAHGQMLLQKRAKGKYHCPGLWTNACCSHPRVGETPIEAAHRRLKEELGFDCALKKAFSFVYKATLDRNLIEHEFDHVFIGTYNGPLDHLNPDEVEECRWIDIPALLQEVKESPQQFTPWFLIALERVLAFQNTA